MNYEQIRADDPGGMIEDALDALSSLEITMPYDERLITERSVYAVLGPLEGEIFISALEAIAQQDTSIARVASWLKPGSEAGIDIAHPVTQAVLGSLVNQGGITQQHIDGIKSLTTYQAKKYPGITYGDIEKARANA